MVSYNQIIARIEAAADAHLQIKQFGNGHTSQIVEKDVVADFKYPMLWVEDRVHSVQDKSHYYNFSLYFCDLVKPDRSNENDVKSDLLLIAQDFIGVLHDLTFVGESNEAYLDKGQSISLEVASEAYADRMTFVRADVRIKQPFEWGTCNVPTDSNANCNGTTRCTALLNRLSASELNECILPNYNFANTVVTDNFTAQQTTDLTSLLCSNDVVSELVYNADSTDIIEDTSVSSNFAGTYTSESLTNVSTVTYEINTGGGYSTVTLPFTLSAGNSFKVTITRTTPSTESIVELTGTY